jgi:hypothetical protein
MPDLTMSLLAYYIGIAIVFFSHLTVLLSGKGMQTHAIINLVAVVLIAQYFLASTAAYKA